MNRFMLRMAAVAVLAGLVGSSTASAVWPFTRTAPAPRPEPIDPEHPGFGVRLNNAYDPCWLPRYSAVARQSILAPFAQQVLNGHVINQTLWNYDFEPGTDRITPAGVEKLDSLVRVRPAPDPKIFIQTARDLAATVDTVDRLAAARNDLDMRRAQTVAKFLASEPRQMPFEIFVHDPTDFGINSTAAGNAFRSQLQGYRGGITGGGVGAQGAGGGGGGGGGGQSAAAPTSVPGTGR
jgi:uncharacterized membrane protein YgcG